MNKVLRWINRNENVIIGLLLGFLSGLLVNEISSSNLSLFAISVLFITLIMIQKSRNFIRDKLKEESLDFGIIKSFRKIRDEEYIDRMELTVGNCVTIQLCPRIQLGWHPSEIEVDFINAIFSVPLEFRDHYEEFKNEFKKQFGQNNETLMLYKLPVSWSDSNQLQLVFQRNSYRNTMFFWQKVYRDKIKHNYYIRKILDQKDADIPHNICLHIALITRDRKILLTKRPHTVATYPSCFSASIEENLLPEDFANYPSGLGIREGVRRGISEELGLELGDDYSEENIRVLSIFLEGGERINIALAVVVRLELEGGHILTEIIKNRIKTDYEAVSFEYLEFDDIYNEIVNPSRPYHPTSKYRILLSALHEFGTQTLEKRLGTQMKKPINF